MTTTGEVTVELQRSWQSSRWGVLVLLVVVVGAAAVLSGNDTHIDGTTVAICIAGACVLGLLSRYREQIWFTLRGYSMGRWYLRAGAGGLALVKSNGRRVATATWDSVAATVCVRSTTNEDGDERLFPCVALRIGDHEISIGSVTPVERSWPRNVKTVRQAPKYQAEQQHLQWLVQALQAKGTTRGWQW